MWGLEMNCDFLDKKQLSKLDRIVTINSTWSEFHLSQSSNMILMLFLSVALDSIFKARKTKLKS